MQDIYQYLDFSPMFISRILIPQLHLSQMPIMEELFCDFLSLAGIHCRKIHDNTNLRNKQKVFEHNYSSKPPIKAVQYSKQRKHNMESEKRFMHPALYLKNKS
jgi:hypothetical protein